MRLIKKIIESYTILDFTANQTIAEQLINADNTLFTTVHPFSYFNLRSADSVIDNLNIIVIDSFSIRMIINTILGNKYPSICFNFTISHKKTKERFYAHEFFSSVKQTDTIAIIGSKDSENELAVSKLKEAYGNVNLIHNSSGYMDATEESALLKKLIELNPRFVICGMGSYRQEMFIIKLKNLGWKGNGICVGGFIQQISRRLFYYPEICEALNIRWLYRIIRNPKLLPRYLFIYPVTYLFLIYDCLRLRSLIK